MSILTKEFVKFLFIGGINTLFGYSIFSLLIFLQVHYALASLLATILGVLFNFKTTGTFVFKNRDNSLLFRFGLVYTVQYFIGVGLLSIFDWYQFSMYFAGAILIFPMGIMSFFLNRLFVFNKRSDIKKNDNAI